MSDEQNERKLTDIGLVRKTLEEEGCPQEFVNELVQYFGSHPESSVRELGQHLDNIACRVGHPSYHSFRRAGFQPHGMDPRLASRV